MLKVGENYYGRIIVDELGDSVAYYWDNEDQKSKDPLWCKKSTFTAWVRKREEEENPIMWLIWSNEHCAWWGPGHRGYVQERSKAGKYHFLEACIIVENANKYQQSDTGIPNEAMVRADVYQK